MPLIKIASLFETISENSSLSKQLNSFKDSYKNLYKKNIETLGASDFSPASMTLLDKINDIDQKQELTENKKNSVKELLAEKGKNLTQFRAQLIDELDHKYQHAHARVSWNYGKFTKTILSQKVPLIEKFAKFKKLTTRANFSLN